MPHDHYSGFRMVPTQTKAYSCTRSELVSAMGYVELHFASPEVNLGIQEGDENEVKEKGA